MKAIEKGWKSYRTMVIPKDASAVQIEECRRAFYAGAAILWEGMMKALDPNDSDATEGDLSIMASIQAELDEFGQNFDKEIFGKHEH